MGAATAINTLRQLTSQAGDPGGNRASVAAEDQLQRGHPPASGSATPLSHVLWTPCGRHFTPSASSGAQGRDIGPCAAALFSCVGGTGRADVVSQRLQQGEHYAVGPTKPALGYILPASTGDAWLAGIVFFRHVACLADATKKHGTNKHPGVAVVSGEGVSRNKRHVLRPPTASNTCDGKGQGEQQ